MTSELHNELLIFLLDPLKPHFYYISTGLRGSISHGDIFMMIYINVEKKIKVKGLKQINK